MWVSEISIDKKYLLEYDYIINRLDKIDNLSYSKESTKDRYICTVATGNEYVKNVKDSLYDIVKKVILVYIKRNYLFKNYEPTSFSEVAIIGSITHFDSLYEEGYLKHKMDSLTDYNIDGILNFRLQKLKENWNELKRLSEDLLYCSDECDLAYVATLMNSSTAERVNEVELSIKDGKYYILANKTLNLEIIDLYKNKYFNILDAIIFLNPHKILINTKLPKEMLNLIKKIMQVNTN